MSTGKEKPIHLLLIAHYALFRESIGRLLSAEPGFKVAAQCATLRQASQILKRQEIDVVLLGFNPGEKEAEEFVRRAKTSMLKGKVLLLAAEVKAEAEAELIRAGVCGIFHMNESARFLGQAIQQVAAGNVWFRQEHLERAFIQASNSVAKPETRKLTDREHWVLSLVSDGLKNREIGAQIGVSEGAVKATLQQLFSKFGVRTRSQLVRIAVDQDKT